MSIKVNEKVSFDEEAYNAWLLNGGDPNDLKIHSFRTQNMGRYGEPEGEPFQRLDVNTYQGGPDILQVGPITIGQADLLRQQLEADPSRAIPLIERAYQMTKTPQADDNTDLLT